MGDQGRGQKPWGQKSRGLRFRTGIPGTVPGTGSAGTEIPGTQIFRGQLSPSPAHLWLGSGLGLFTL